MADLTELGRRPIRRAISLGQVEVEAEHRASRWRPGSRRTARMTSCRSSSPSTAASAEAVGGWYAVSLRPVARRRNADRQPFSTELRT